MTNETSKLAGQYTLNSIRISSPHTEVGDVEMTDLVASWSLSESMENSFLSGSMTVLDGVGLLYSFPIRGEEYIEITYTDWYGEKLTEKLFVYAVTDISRVKDRGDNTMLSYDLHMVSRSKFLTDSKKIRRGYRGFVENLAEDIYKEYYPPEKPFDNQNTSAEQWFTIPDLTPDQAMHFLTRRAYSNITQSQSFRFFESRKEFVFGTTEYMILRGSVQDEIPKFVHGLATDKTPGQQGLIMHNIIDFSMAKEYVNSQREMNYNPYYRVTMEIDYLNRGVITSEPFDYLQKSRNFTSTPRGEDESIRPKKSEAFVQEHFAEDPKRHLILKNYAGNNEFPSGSRNPQTHYGDIIMAKDTYFYHWIQDALRIKIYGRNDIFAGSLVEVNIGETRFQGALDSERSGVYLVEECLNTFSMGEYTQTLTLSRGGIQK